MFAPKGLPLSRQTVSQLLKTITSLPNSYSIACAGQWCGGAATQNHLVARSFSSTPTTRLRVVSPVAQGAHVNAKEDPAWLQQEHEVKGGLENVSTRLILKTDPAWPHPGYDVMEMRENVSVLHRKPRDFSDRVALATIRFARWGMDLVTGYHHDNDTDEPKTVRDKNALTSAKPYRMSEAKWMSRFVFLETVAGVPGSVAGTLRHLQSIRRLKRDNGWIESLLEESYNERMHLLTFIKMTEPGWFMRLMILGAQGVFFNAFFLSYLVSPRTCHRFVGYLEEEAVYTYSLAIKDLEAGKLPKWQNVEVPQLAIDYWKMPEGHRTMADLLYYIRADEAKHREVNHTLGNLRQKEDPNPFVSTYRDPTRPHPNHGLKYMKEKGAGWEREEVI